MKIFFIYKNEDFTNITRLNKACFFYVLDTWEHITSIKSQVFDLKMIETCGGDHIFTFLSPKGKVIRNFKGKY